MHGSVMAYLREQVHLGDPWNVMVIEFGSMDVVGDVEGTARDVFAEKSLRGYGPRAYIGLDQRAGPNVDVVMDAADAPAHFRGFDVAVSTEMLEHAADWHGALAGMVGVLRSGGLLIVTTRGPGAGRHDHPGDHWRFTPELLADAVTLLGCNVLDCRADPEIPGVFLTARLYAASDHRAFRRLEAERVADPAPMM